MKRGLQTSAQLWTGSCFEKTISCKHGAIFMNWKTTQKVQAEPNGWRKEPPPVSQEKLQQSPNHKTDSIYPVRFQTFYDQ